MKKIIFIAILLIPSYALALGAGFVGLSAGASGAAATCGVQDSQTDGSSQTLYMGYTNHGTCSYSTFTPETSYTLKSLSLWLKKAGSGTSTISVKLCTDTSGATCTTIGTIAEADLTTSNVKYTWSYPTGYEITQSGSTQYVIMLSTDRAESGGNVIYPLYNSAVTGEAMYEADVGACTAKAFDTSAQFNYEASTCE